jgi:ParB family transcriptional regulator, chromosome partitioning protein
MVKKRGLGKPLDALLSYTHNENVIELESARQEKFCHLPIDQIQRGKYQPRREMDSEALEELAHSIRVQGIIQPLIVRPSGDKYEIIAGERRWRAAGLAGLTEVPAIIRHIPDETAIAIALIENIQRENLNPVEESLALQRLIDEFGMTHQQVAEAVGKSRATITNLLRLLTLPEEIRALLERSQIEMGHARALITLPTDLQIKAAETIVARQLSVRDTETLVRKWQEIKKPASAKTPISPNILDLQDTLAKNLKLKVAIKCNAKGRGKLIIHYRSLAELDALMGQFNLE